MNKKMKMNGSKPKDLYVWKKQFEPIPSYLPCY